jgi:hypothetical protein
MNPHILEVHSTYITVVKLRGLNLFCGSAGAYKYDIYKPTRSLLNKTSLYC